MTRKLFHLLGGREAMLESPVLQEFVREREQAAAKKAAKEAAKETAKAVRAAKEAARQSFLNNILTVLTTRFGAGANDMGSALKSERGEDRLNTLLKQAITVPNPAAFRALLKKS